MSLISAPNQPKDTEPVEATTNPHEFMNKVVAVVSTSDSADFIDRLSIVSSATPSENSLTEVRPEISIEKITDTKLVEDENGLTRFYKVQWSTWECENNLMKHSNELIHAFWENKDDENNNGKDTLNDTQQEQFVSKKITPETDFTISKKGRKRKLVKATAIELPLKTQKNNSLKRKAPRKKNVGKITGKKKSEQKSKSKIDKEKKDEDILYLPGEKDELAINTDSTFDDKDTDDNSEKDEDIQDTNKATKTNNIKGTPAERKSREIITCECGRSFNNSYYKEKCRYCTNTCTECGKKFKRPSALRNHFEGVHEKNRKHRCDICNKSFFTRHYLTNHILKHSDQRNYECEICQKKFKDITKLKRHKLIHTGVKPHKCSVCQREFLQSEALKKHMLLHTDGPRRFQCLLCKKGFNHKVSLKSHMLKHHDKNEQQAAVMIGLWKKYQQTDAGASENLVYDHSDVLSRALNDVVMIPQDGSAPVNVPLESEMNQSLPLFNFSSVGLNLPMHN